jgi:formamidopyrimidine-DNA glycosylase
VSEAGQAVRICGSCGFQEKDSQPRVIRSYYGQLSAKTTENGNEERLIGDIVNDPTVFSPPGVICPECYGPVKADMQRNQQYIFVCPTCRKVVTPLPAHGH